MAIDKSESPEREISPKERRFPWVWGVLLLGILLLGAAFRTVGMDWDQDNHLHPDERFMTIVASSISFPEEWSTYFDTEHSSLNPHNRGQGFYVYGTLPLFIVRYVAESLDKTGYSQIYLVGRYLSALASLLTVLLVYLIARRLYKKERLALVAAVFSACSVLEIQLSHYFTVDTYANFFIFLAFYFAVVVLTEPNPALRPSPEVASRPARFSWDWVWGSRKSLLPCVLFGVALGMAMASKVSAAPLALLLPAVLLIQFSRAPEEDRDRLVVILLRNLLVAALVSFIVFRVFQPYAFKGPGFFGMGLNERWIDNLSDLSVQSKGDVDFPPALQWARRPLTFAWENMVVWGLGLPLGLAAWAGFLWIAWRMLKGEWRTHAVLWGWTACYFVWQSLNFSRSMRYQLPIYPALAIMAAWLVFALWEKGTRPRPDGTEKRRRGAFRAAAIVVGLVTVVGSAAWAFAFTRIYTRPVTRLAASEWIYQNVPSAINMHIETEESGEVFNLTLPFRSIATLSFEQPLVLAFQPQETGAVQELVIGHIIDPLLSPSEKTIRVEISSDREGDDILTGGTLTGDFTRADDPRGVEYKVLLDRPARIEAGVTYYVILDLEFPNPLNLAGELSVGIHTDEGRIYQILPDLVRTITEGENFSTSFNGYRTGTVREVYLPHVVDWESRPGEKRLRLTVSGNGLAQSSQLVSDFSAGSDPRGQGYSFVFDPPLAIQADQTYSLQLEVQGEGAIALYGTRHAIESSWDDPLPYPLPGYNNPFDYNLGVYRSDLNFEMYWDDNAEKLRRFESILDRADVIYISSNRQWGTTTRVPERYPLTSAYYRNLIGCPADTDILWCYRVAEPGMFQGSLGFDLVQVFQSDPNLGPVRFNSQFAEEAFTVYDHPKVLIFEKNENYDPEKVRDILGSVDLTTVVHLTPGKAAGYKGNLLLPEERLAGQRSGGTWSELFNRLSLFNRYPVLALLLWYLTITVLGWAVYPLMRVVFRGLSDRGYPAARLFGVILLAFLVWVGGSFGIPVTRLMIGAAVLILLLIGAVLAYSQRDELREEWQERKRYFLTVEGITLALFAVFILIRVGNPDLWHPYKGGEKPMDFSYFNAVLKSTTFPPYDPWFAGGYLNYYYYGFVLAGMPVKLLGIIPSIAYNLVLATWFSFLGMGAFSTGWNLVTGFLKNGAGADVPEERVKLPGGRPYFGGIASIFLLAVFGNFGTVRMIWQGLQRLVAPGSIEDGNVFQHLAWAFSGLGRFIEGQSLPYGPGDWYWIPSRVIPGEPITEFPAFTFLYADPHAHLLALPVTVLSLLWLISVLKLGLHQTLLEGRSGWLKALLVMLSGGVILGALRPTNTWDFPTFLTLAGVAVIYSLLTSPLKTRIFGIDPSSRIPRLVTALFGAGLLVLLAFVLYQPYADWYGQGYNAVEIWKGDRTPLQSYLTQWGLFLFILASWFTWESRDWMANTPASALKRLRPYQAHIQGALIFLAVLGLGLLFWGVKVVVIALPLAAWAAVLILRPGQPAEKRAVLFMTGTALVLTLLVEVSALKGDLGRMNWVFKFYLQAWTLLSLSAAAALTWLVVSVLPEWRPRLQKAWQVVLVLGLFGAALFPLMAGSDKIRDRMTDAAPHGLDGMRYMAFASYDQEGHIMQLAEDYRAIQWMQDNVQGSPVIVEANTPEYRWGSRFTIYTGLPGVVGWNWHQRQQRAIDPQEWVTGRVQEIGDFYSFTDRDMAAHFLKKYDVQYIVVGQLEKAVYPALGLAKFAEWEGELWKEVYHDGETSIYQVLP